MKKIILLIIAFLIFTILINFCPVITLWDKSFIISIQNLMKNIPVIFALLPDCILYSIMIALPLITGGIYFIINKNRINFIILCTLPLAPFLLNCIIKPLLHRQRPPMELQLSIHPHSFSYVSSHSLVTFCLWGGVIYFLNRYCKNKYLKFTGILFSILWILYVGISRIWLGVHHPSDVLGAYILGSIIVLFYIKLFEKFEVQE